MNRFEAEKIRMMVEESVNQKESKEMFLLRLRDFGIKKQIRFSEWIQLVEAQSNNELTVDKVIKILK